LSGHGVTLLCPAYRFGRPRHAKTDFTVKMVGSMPSNDIIDQPAPLRAFIAALFIGDALKVSLNKFIATFFVPAMLTLICSFLIFCAGYSSPGERSHYAAWHYPRSRQRYRQRIEKNHAGTAS
jgi:hypothetical protein